MKKAFLGLTVVGVLLFGACSDMGETVEEKKEPVEEVDEKEKVVEEEKVEVVEEVEDTDKQKISEQATLLLLQENFNSIGKVTFDEEYKSFHILPTNEDISLALVMMSQGTMPKDTWFDLVESFITLSRMIQDQVGTGYTLHMLNPSNQDNVILSVLDGVVVYDAINQ